MLFEWSHHKRGFLNAFKETNFRYKDFWRLPEDASFRRINVCYEGFAHIYSQLSKNSLLLNFGVFSADPIKYIVFKYLLVEVSKNWIDLKYEYQIVSKFKFKKRPLNLKKKVFGGVCSLKKDTHGFEGFKETNFSNKFFQGFGRMHSLNQTIFVTKGSPISSLLLTNSSIFFFT